MSSDNDTVNVFFGFIGLVLIFAGVIVSLVTGGIGTVFGIPMAMVGAGLLKGSGKG